VSIKSRRKGVREELKLERFLQDHGFAAEKISRAGYDGADLSVPILGIDRAVEVKVRAGGFKRIYEWLEARDILVIRADRKEALVVVPLKLAVEIAARAEVRDGGPA
jgi:hypothetical protein